MSAHPQGIKTPRVDRLTEPAVPGRAYMVPTFAAEWHGRRHHWPVLHSAHTDAEFFNVPQRHHHVDTRFFSDHDLRWWANKIRVPVGGWTIVPNQLSRVVIGWRRLVCRREFIPFPGDGVAGVDEMQAALAGVKIKADADGMRRCPHKGMPLGSVAADADGVVRCPLHGLRICGRRWVVLGVGEGKMG